LFQSPGLPLDSFYREAIVCWVGRTSSKAVLCFQILGEVLEETSVIVEGAATEPNSVAATLLKP